MAARSRRQRRLVVAQASGSSRAVACVLGRDQGHGEVLLLPDGSVPLLEDEGGESAEDAVT